VVEVSDNQYLSLVLGDTLTKELGTRAATFLWRETKSQSGRSPRQLAWYLSNQVTAELWRRGGFSRFEWVARRPTVAEVREEMGR
jgi:hypothetical protein